MPQELRRHGTKEGKLGGPFLGKFYGCFLPLVQPIIPFLTLLAPKNDPCLLTTHQTWQISSGSYVNSLILLCSQGGMTECFGWTCVWKYQHILDIHCDSGIQSVPLFEEHWPSQSSGGSRSFLYQLPSSTQAGKWGPTPLLSEKSQQAYGADWMKKNHRIFSF